MDNDEFFNLLGKTEPLHPELEDFLTVSRFGAAMLHHKWIIEPFFDSKRCALINLRYEFKKAEVAKAKADNNRVRYVFLHERPYRLEAYMEVFQEIQDSKAEADLFRQVWCDSENIYQHHKTWAHLWRRIQPEHIMNDEEKEAFAALPDPFPIYRGIRYLKAKRGMSWTPDKGTALKFAHRFAGPQKILVEGMVPKAKVLAYLHDRETEVIAFPQFIQKKKEQWL